MRSPPLVAALALACTLTLAAPARAVDFQADVFAGGQGSSWRSDGAAFGSLKLGVRFLDLLAPYFLARVGYGTVDQRMLTLVSIGGQIWGRLGFTRPYARIGLAHQHEESAAVVQTDPFGALFGVGDGIRHRGGFEGGLGIDLPFKSTRKVEFHATIDSLITWFPDPRGPKIYAGASAGLGLNYHL
jgi:hypothetical protein